MLNNARMVKLGELIEECNKRNSDKRFGADDVIGMTITKQIIPTKANVKDTDLSNFLIVEPNQFVYNPRTHGKKIGLGFNDTDRCFLISWNNSVFRIKDTTKVIPKYLYLIFSREEWDRNACFRSWGSSTEVFSWSEFSLMEIPLPSIEVQRDLVEIYEGLEKIVSENEVLTKQMESICHDFIVDCKYKYPKVKLGDWIEIQEKRNEEGKDYLFSGVNKNKSFMPTVADTNELDNTKYKVVSKDMFVFSGMQTGRDECIRLALYDEDTPILISPAYTTFVIKEKVLLLPLYFFMVFCRPEMDRYGAFLSDGSIRSNLDWERFCEIEIPLPPIEVQHSIATIAHSLQESKRIVQDAKDLMKTICPALVQKAAHSA